MDGDAVRDWLTVGELRKWAADSRQRTTLETGATIPVRLSADMVDEIANWIEELETLADRAEAQLNDRGYYLE